MQSRWTGHLELYSFPKRVSCLSCNRRVTRGLARQRPDALRTIRKITTVILTVRYIEMMTLYCTRQSNLPYTINSSKQEEVKWLAIDHHQPRSCTPSHPHRLASCLRSHQSQTAKMKLATSGSTRWALFQSP